VHLPTIIVLIPAEPLILMSLVYALTSSPSYASSLASTYDAYAFALPDFVLGGGKSIAQGCPFVVGFTA
jgi:hypothetical protein